jgi:hypothetical protein
MPWLVAELVSSATAMIDEVDVAVKAATLSR